MNKITSVRQFNPDIGEELYEFTGLKADEDGDEFRFFPNQVEGDRSYYDGMDELDETFEDEFMSFKLDIEYEN